MKKLAVIREVPMVSPPRERLIQYGEQALSDYELLAILLRTGTKEEHVVQVAIRCLQTFDSLNHLKLASVEELQQVKGIGPTKAIELGVRIARSCMPKYGTLSSTRRAGEWLAQEMKDLHQEHLVALFLNSKNEIIRKRTIFKGSVNQSVAHPREIFKEAVKYPTARMIIAHNHPSGDTKPSQEDIVFTERMLLCGDLMGIELLDHLIIGHGDYLSLRESTTIFN